MAISMHPLAKQRRALRRKRLRDGGYWADLCRTKNGKPVYRWVHLRMRPEKAMRCDCQRCRSQRQLTQADIRMVVCPICGNKRCPKANYHLNPCTGSNEPGQPGSAY